MSIKKREYHGPSLIEVVLGVALSLALGATMGVVFLILKPVTVAKDLPKETERVPGMIYYLEGGRDGAKGRLWKEKRKQFVDGKPGEIALVEDELNRWVTDGVKPKAPATPAPAAPAPGAKPVAATEPVAESGIVFNPPNFRIRNGVLQMGMQTTITQFGETFPIVCFTQGKFVKSGEGAAFDPEKVYVGSFPLHRFPGATSYIIRKANEAGWMPAEAVEAWSRVGDATIEDRTVKLTIKGTPAPAQTQPEAAAAGS